MLTGHLEERQDDLDGDENEDVSFLAYGTLGV